MKKFLLSIFAVMTAAGFAGAETVELNVNDATGFDGTLIEETFNNDGSVKAAKHYQPINSFNIGGFDFQFSTINETETSAPAYYWSTSTTAADKQQQTIRIYNGTTMTVTAPEGVNMTKVEFTGSNAGKNLAVTATPGDFTLNKNNGTWTGSSNTFSITVSATWRISKLVITTGEGGDPVDPIDPPVVEKAKFVKAAVVESGKKYLLVADGQAATGKVKNDAAYGYLLVDAVTVDGDVATAPAGYAFTITAVEGAYTIQRPDGTYVAMKGTFNSFNFYASPEEWYEWVISINNDGTADIWNSDVDKYVAYDNSYSSFGCYPEERAETLVKPTLYVLDEGQSGVAEIVIDESAPVEYFNIQGVKVNVENAAPGLYIRRQGNVATKVIVK